MVSSLGYIKDRKIDYFSLLVINSIFRVKIVRYYRYEPYLLEYQNSYLKITV